MICSPAKSSSFSYTSILQSISFRNAINFEKIWLKYRKRGFFIEPNGLVRPNLALTNNMFLFREVKYPASVCDSPEIECNVYHYTSVRCPSRVLEVRQMMEDVDVTSNFLMKKGSWRVHQVVAGRDWQMKATDKLDQKRGLTKYGGLFFSFSPLIPLKIQLIFF